MRDGRAKPADHVGDDRVIADQQALLVNIRRQMPIAEMLRNAGEMPGVEAGDFQELFQRGFHPDPSAVLQHQRIPILQRRHVGEVEEEIQAAICRHCDAAAMPVIEIQYDTIEGASNPRSECAAAGF